MIMHCCISHFKTANITNLKKIWQNYIFNIDGAGCVNQRIGKYPMETCGGKITDISISGAWGGTSINIDESDTTYGYIVLSVPSNDSATDGRSQDVTITFKNDGTETSVTATLCQTNNGSEPPEPTGVKATMIMIDSSSASVACDDENKTLSNTDLENAGVTIANVKNAKFGSCINKFTGFTFNGNSNLTSCTFNNDIELEVIPNSFLKETNIKTLSIPSSVKTVGSEMCSDCYELTSYTVPNDSVMTTLGRMAFNNCFKLESAVLPSGITKINDRTFNQCRSLRSITIPDNVTLVDDWAFYKCSAMTEATITNNAPITKFGQDSFYGCESLKKINIPHTVQQIDIHAFENCKVLSAATIENTSTNPSVLKTISANAFNSCKALKKMDFPKTLETIGNSAFNDCWALTSATFETDSVLSIIGDSAFENCTSLRNITIPRTTTQIQNDAFYNCTAMTTFTISNPTANPSLLTTIGKRAFCNCSSATNGIKIYSAVTSLGEAAFMQCKRAPSITFETPIQITKIPKSCFEECTTLSSIFIPNVIQEVDDDAFYKCSAATSLTFDTPYQTTRIGYRAFGWCESVPKVIIPSTVETIDGGAFYNCSSLTAVTFANYQTLKTIGNNTFGSCSSLSSITIPNSVTSIGSYCFSYCLSLATVNNSDSSNSIPTGVTTIERGAFDNTAISAITLHNGITKIDVSAFFGTKLVNITIPSTVTVIGNYAFGNCSLLQRVTIYATTPPTIDNTDIGSMEPDKPFINAHSLTQIRVPHGCVDAYKSAPGWSNYASIIDSTA